MAQIRLDYIKQIALLICFITNPRAQCHRLNITFLLSLVELAVYDPEILPHDSSLY